MRTASLALAAAIMVAGFFASSAWAADNPCKAHKAQADCTADKVCSWDAAKSKCKKVEG